MVNLPESAPTTSTPGGAGAARYRRHAAGPHPCGEQTLAARAGEVLRIRAGRVPARWRLAGFARSVDLVRDQLGPLRDRAMLADSFEREGARLAALRRLAADPALPPLPVDPLEVAYAVRWLELTEGGRPLPRWSIIVGTEEGPPG